MDIFLINLKKWRISKSFSFFDSDPTKALEEKIKTIEFSPSEPRYLACSSQGNAFVIWDIEESKKIYSLSTSTNLEEFRWNNFDHNLILFSYEEGKANLGQFFENFFFAGDIKLLHLQNQSFEKLDNFGAHPWILRWSPSTVFQ